MSDFSAVTNFIATPYDSGVLLSWVAGKGLADSTAAENCKVTIQYSNNGVIHINPNTPPYVVRDLEGPQTRLNMVYHRGLFNGVPYYYTLFITYEDTGQSYGPFTLSSTVTPVSGTYLFHSGSVSYTKLGTNTRTPGGGSVSRTEVIVWLFPDQEARKPAIESAIRSVSPSHTTVDIIYEPWYVAHTTTAQFQSLVFDPTVYEIKNGVIRNIVPTIDSSYNGTPQIL